MEQLRRMLHRLWNRACGGQEGQSYLMFLVALPVFLILMVLVVDGGRMYLEYIRAQNAANLTAQAGAQAVDTAFFKEEDRVILNIDGSLGIMQEYMPMNSETRQGEVHTLYHGHTANARVCTWTEVETLFARIIGMNTIRVGACAEAYPAAGIRAEGD